MTLHKINCKRRVILTGTPIQVSAAVGTFVAHSVLIETRVLVQNDLKEYFSLLNFCNPGSLGNDTDFHKTFEMPILKGRDALATDKEKERGDAAMKELAGKVNKLIIRRTNDLLSKYCKPMSAHHCFPPPHQQIDD
jgi:DNA repair and recombination RAD54-like protein